ncbi:MAG TPA: cysteine--1-D-myo-inosityl 2-amino-2-deoxy-alpha-D-glucopyranoside ligase [Mycobacteriales bacterium]
MRSWPAVEVPALPGTGQPLRVRDTASVDPQTGGAALRALAPGPTASLYVCGITPYDATHLGHAATYVTFDLLQRVLRDGGHAVAYVQNVTDVDDPLLERAARDGVDWRELAEREIQLFRDDMTALRVLPPDAYVGVVEAIPVVLEMIGRLAEQGATYDLDGDVYFAVASEPRFGEVGHLDRAAMLAFAAERGGDPDRPGKKDALDPLLWRAARPGEPSWPSPYGRGRPGWHVECAAIATQQLGATLDVQGGGVDLVFPHHEMSAAHAQVATGAWPFARAYVHQAMVGYDGHKMSKSRGNLVLVSQLRAAGVDPMAVRLALLEHRHDADWEWTSADLAAATERLDRWRRATASGAGPAAAPTLDRVRQLLAAGLDSPRALEAVDRWAADAAAHRGDDPAAPGLVRSCCDALLGVLL